VVCSVRIFTVIHQGAACDVVSVHFGPTIIRTDIVVGIASDRQNC